MSATPAESQDLTLDKLQAVTAAAVLLEHIIIASDAFEFAPESLSCWAAALLEEALPLIRSQLKQHGADFQAVCSRDAFRLQRLDGKDFESPDEIRKLLASICAEVVGLKVDWLLPLQATVSAISGVLREVMDWPGRVDVGPLSKVAVQTAVMFNEDWSTPYEVCWQADGSANSITMPDVGNYSDRHFALFAQNHGHRHPGQTLVFEYLSTFVVPCHEVLHIVQHLHGRLQDPDSHSYAMEHDASRLNYVLLWQVMERLCSTESDRGWFRWVVMLEGVNRSLKAWHAFHGELASHFQAYRRWADSFGLVSPGAAYATDEGAALRLENLSKYLVAGEGLEVAPVPPSREHLAALLQTAFHTDRSGNVYSAENAELVRSSLPAHLHLGGSGRQFFPLVSAEPAVATRLRSALESKQV